MTFFTFDRMAEWYQTEWHLLEWHLMEWLLARYFFFKRVYTELFLLFCWMSFWRVPFNRMSWHRLTLSINCQSLSLSIQSLSIFVTNWHFFHFFSSKFFCFRLVQIYWNWYFILGSTPFGQKPFGQQTFGQLTKYKMLLEQGQMLNNFLCSSMVSICFSFKPKLKHYVLFSLDVQDLGHCRFLIYYCRLLILNQRVTFLWDVYDFNHHELVSMHFSFLSQNWTKYISFSLDVQDLGHCRFLQICLATFEPKSNIFIRCLWFQPWICFCFWSQNLTNMHYLLIRCLWFRPLCYLLF